MKKSDDYWNGFLYGSFIGIFAGITIGFLMWGTTVDTESKSAYTKFDEKQFEFKK
jgi:hypothetical protein